MPEEVSELLMTLRAIGPTARETNDQALRLPVGERGGERHFAKFSPPFETVWPVF